MSHVVEINQFEHLAYYRMAWKSLLGQTRGATFFQSLDWLEAYWRHFGPQQKLRVLLVFEGNSVQGNSWVGILPLAVRTEVKNLIATRMLTYPLTDWGAAYGPIGPNPTATLLSAMRHIRDSQRDWDMIDLRWTNDGRRAETAMNQVGMPSERSIWCHSSQVDLDGDWEAYWMSRSDEFRNKYRCSLRDVRNLDGRGTLHCEHYRPAGAAQGDADPRWDLYEHCQQVANRSRQRNVQTGTTLDRKSARPFLSDIHEVAARVGVLDMHLLYVGNRPVAYANNFHLSGHVVGFRSGLDPEFAAAGVDIVLAMSALEACFQYKDQTYDFGPRSHTVDRHIADRIRTSYCYSYYPRLNFSAQNVRARRWFRRRSQGDAVDTRRARERKA